MSRGFTNVYSRIVIGCVTLLLGLAALTSGIALLSSADSPTSAETPIIVETPFMAIANSDYHSLALNSDGTMWSWGNNSRGQIGDGTLTTRKLPIHLSLSNIIDIAATSHHSAALASDGTVWVWGLGHYYCNGSPQPSQSQYARPYSFSSSSFGNKKIVDITVGDHYTLALDEDGDVWAWGANSNGQLGRAAGSYTRVPAKVPGLSNIVSVVAGSNGVIDVYGHNLALDKDGNVFAWGRNTNGQLGNGTVARTHVPYRIPESRFDGRRITQIAASSNHSVALDEDGNVWAWGANSNGQLSDGTTTQRNTPTMIRASKFNYANILGIAAGDAHSMAYDASGNVWLWGSNGSGQLGNGTKTSSSSPEMITSDKFDGKQVTSIAASGNNSMAITHDGSVWAWGHNSYGQIGNGTTAGASEPVLVFTLLGPRYGVSLNITGTHQFDSLEFDYNTIPDSLTILLKNIGNMPTGDLKVTISGPNADSFILSTFSVPDLPEANATASFTVEPKLGLAPGLHTAIVTVSGDNISTQTFNVSFFVKLYGIALNPSVHTFETATLGYERTETRAITITNIGNMPTGPLNVSLSGSNANAFELSNISASLAVGGSSSFTVKPIRGLQPGTYTATVTVQGESYIKPQTMQVNFTVISFGISITPEKHIFAAQGVGYTTAPPATTATVTNIGDMPTGNLLILVTGASPNAFIVSASSITNLENKGDKATFTVRPKDNLPGGIYLARITVSGENTADRHFEVAFLVGYSGIMLSQTETHIFLPSAVGYTIPPTQLPVTVSNIGNQETGPLTVSLSGPSSGSFSLSRVAIASLPVDGSASFFVRPTTGLPGGIHTATVIVSGPSVTSQSFRVNFSVGAFGLEVAKGPHHIIARYGYPPPNGLPVQISNTGTLAIGTLNISLSDTTAFTLSTTKITAFAPNQAAVITVKPRQGLNPGFYLATVTVNCDYLTNYTFDVTVAVYKYGCPCGIGGHANDTYYLLLLVPCIAALALLLWLGLRQMNPTPLKPPPQKTKAQKKADDDHLNHLLVTSVAQWTANHQRVQVQTQMQHSNQHLTANVAAWTSQHARMNASRPPANTHLIKTKEGIAPQTPPRPTAYPSAPATTPFPAQTTQRPTGHPPSTPTQQQRQSAPIQPNGNSMRPPYPPTQK